MARKMFEHAVSRNSIALPETFKQPVPAWGCALSVSPSHIKCVCVCVFFVSLVGRPDPANMFLFFSWGGEAKNGWVQRETKAP